MNSANQFGRKLQKIIHKALTDPCLRVLKPFLPSRLIATLEAAALFIFIGTLNNILAYIFFVLALNFLDLTRTWSLCGAYIVGLVAAYFSFKNIVFADSVGTPYARFLASYLLLFAINRFLLEALVIWFNLSSEIGQLILLAPIALISFLLNRYWVFRAGGAATR